jgi:hypothetical protein
MGMVVGSQRYLGFELIRMQRHAGSQRIRFGPERDTIRERIKARMVKSADTADLKSFGYDLEIVINISK